MLTQEQLKKHLEYNPATGEFVCLTRRGTCRPGDVAGYNHHDGRRMIGLLGKQYHAHRLAWFYITGSWPTDEIDHRDCDPSNNRWSNLRQATRSQNSRNKRLFRNNTTGFKGVTFHKSMGKFMAQLSVQTQQSDGKKKQKVKNLGYFDDAYTAHLAYCKAAAAAFGEFARFS